MKKNSICFRVCDCLCLKIREEMSDLNDQVNYFSCSDLLELEVCQSFYTDSSKSMILWKEPTFGLSTAANLLHMIYDGCIFTWIWFDQAVL